MSEEEIIKILEDRLENSNQYVLYHCWVGTECFEAIQGLLDLYNKEKEKNKILSIQIIENEKLYDKETARLGNLIQELLEERN